MSATVTSAGSVSVTSQGGANGGQATTLMPTPETISPGGLDAALGALYAAMSQQRQGALQFGQGRVASVEKTQTQALQREKDAEAREAAARASQGSGLFGSIGNFISDVTTQIGQGRIDHALTDGAKDVDGAVHSPAFWNDLETGALDVAKVAAMVGSVTATVASGGAAGATIAGAALLLSLGGEAVTATKCFGSDSDAIGLGMEAGAAVAGGVGGLVASASTAGSGGLSALSTGAEGVSAGATGVGGVAHVKNAELAADVQGAAADATEATHQRQAMQRLAVSVVDDMKADDKSRQAGIKAVQGAIEANDQAAAVAVTPVTVKG